MTAPRPSARFDFANTPGYLDTRITFTRGSSGSFINSLGNIEHAPASAPRWTFDPLTGECQGIIIEPERTNTFLYSEDFSNAAWTKTNCSVTSNSVVAPDGTTTGDTITASTTNGAITQTITISSVGNIIFCSVFAKANTSNFLRLRLSGGSDTVDCWFNLATYEAASNTAGSTTCAYLAKQVELLPNGWVRCGLAVTTASATSFTASFARSF